ncbi:MAG TPA: SDR family NAD(P)-dependent oxidoreductase, partial [Polyangiaceae bacterium]
MAGRKTLIVGATGRLGVAIAKALHARGDHVVLTARDPNKLDAMSKELGDCAYVTSDLLRDDAVETIVK